MASSSMLKPHTSCHCGPRPSLNQRLIGYSPLSSNTWSRSASSGLQTPLQQCTSISALALHSSQHRRPQCLVASQAGTGANNTSRPVKKKAKKLVDINGDVTKDMGNGMFTIKLENGVSVMAHLSGKIRQNRIKIVAGDKVTVELSPYDLTRGRITYRFKPGELAAAQAAAGQANSQ